MDINIKKALLARLRYFSDVVDALKKAKPQRGC